MSRFDNLIGLIEQLKNDKFGEIIVDREHKGTIDDPIHFPFPVYTDTVHELIQAIYDIEREYPEYELTKYGDILKERGIEWQHKSMEKADVSNMDVQGILALLMGMVRGERFCDGTILAMLKAGTVLRWLERLKEIVNDK